MNIIKEGCLATAIILGVVSVSPMIKSHSEKNTKTEASPSAKKVIPTYCPTPVMDPTQLPTNPTIAPTQVVSQVEYTKEEIVLAINKELVGGRLEGFGEVFYQAYEKYNVSASMMAAICIFESRTSVNGKHVAGTSRDTIKLNNPCGMNVRSGFPHEGRYAKYPDLNTAIYDLAYWLRHYYLDGNNHKNIKCQDVWDIASLYCPEDDPDNGKWGMNNKLWPSFVENKYNDIINHAKMLYKNK